MASVAVRLLFYGIVFYSVRYRRVVVGKDVQLLIFWSFTSHVISVVQHFFHTASILVELEQVVVRLCEQPHRIRREINIFSVSRRVFQLELCRINFYGIRWKVAAILFCTVLSFLNILIANYGDAFFVLYFDTLHAEVHSHLRVFVSGQFYASVHLCTFTVLAFQGFEYVDHNISACPV